MSKASEFVAAYKKRPSINLPGGPYCDVTLDGQCSIAHDRVILAPGAALALARWILDTFADDATGGATGLIPAAR